MSTSAYIALKEKDGKVRAIYSHSDGYYEYVGKILNLHYKDYEKVKRLIDLGDISELGENPEATEAVKRWGFDYRYNEDFLNSEFAVEDEYGFIRDIDDGKGTIAYHRDRGEELYINIYEDEECFLKKLPDYIEYIYLFKDGEWFSVVENGSRLIPLSSIKDCSEPALS